MQDVIGRTAYTDCGPVQLGQNNHVRPGMTLLASGGLAAGSTNQHRAYGVPSRGGVFPTTTSFDSPQRPGFWVVPHTPAVLSDGTFIGSGGDVEAGKLGAVLDDGSVYGIPLAFAVDHQARVIRHLIGIDVIRNQPRIEDRGGVAADIGPGGTLNDNRFEMIPLGEAFMGSMVYTFEDQIVSYSGEIERFPAPSTSTNSRLQYYQLSQNGGVCTEYFLDEQWMLMEPGGDPDLESWQRYWRVTGYFPDDRNPGQVLLVGISASGNILQRKIWREYGISIPANPPLNVFVNRLRGNRLVYYLENLNGPLPEMTGGWASPDGQVIREGRVEDHALLGTDVGLSAYGAALTGGSWAALCGPTSPQGVTEPWILHESGPTVTCVKASGEVSSIPRVVFEREVLRCSVGTFVRFDQTGTLFNTWPPQWALAQCQGALRAVCLHDPWRDSVKGNAPNADPAWWYWPSRPLRRPTIMPASAPVAPLGLALADVFVLDSGGGPGGET